MIVFTSNYTNKVDKKGRVSVPAPFRARLGSPALIYVYTSFRLPCLEGGDPAFMEELGARIDQSYDLFTDDHDDMAQAILGEARPLTLDGEGRVLLPDALVGFAGISSHATFVGLGKTFQIWEPDAFASRRADRLKRLAARKTGLKPLAHGPDGRPGGGGDR